MKLLKSTLIIALCSTFINAHAAKVETELEKLSYSMGAYFGHTVTRQDMDLDIPAFLQAVEDVLKGAETKMTTEEMQQVLSAYQQKEQEEQVAIANANKTKGEAYLVDNKKKEGVTVTDSGLQYKVIKAGDGKKPTADSTVVVHYRGTLIDGKEFDSSYSRGEPAELGVSRVIKGWQEALSLMPAGSKWQLTIPSDLAYGPRGAGGAIGPNAVLLFDIELIEVK